MHKDFYGGQLLIDDVMADDCYFEWLLESADPKGIDTEYSLMMQELHRKIFYSLDLTRKLAIMDQNRIDDAYQLRLEFENETSNICLLDSQPSILEIMVALCRKIARTVSYSGDRIYPWYWFSIIIDNMKLWAFSDRALLEDDGLYLELDDILSMFLDRTYSPSGQPAGCMFPIEDPPSDLRETDIWMQWQLWAAKNL